MDPTVTRNASQNKETPLHVASKEGHLEVVLALIAVGADVHAKDVSVGVETVIAGA